MKKTFILQLAAVLLLAVSCNKNNDIYNAGHGKASLSLSVTHGITFSDSEFETKADQSESERRIERLCLMIFDDNGYLEWYDKEATINGTKTVAGLEEGPKTVWAVANKSLDIPDMSERRWTMAELREVTSSLADNKRDALVMTGSVRAVAGTDAKEAIVELRKICAKISFRNSIVTTWGANKPQKGFDIDKVYIANVGTESNFQNKDLHTELINPRAELEQTHEDILADFTVSPRTRQWVSGDVFNKGVDFYVYPNEDADNRTTVIIEATFDGRKCYYPIVLDCDIVSGYCYRIGKVEITCEGMTTPGEDFTKVKTVTGVESANWSDPSSLPSSYEF